MKEYKDKLKLKTRWDNIPDQEDGYRLSCANSACSLSCANLRNGRLAVTSMHGSERHSYALTKIDMTFAVVEFLNNLEESELATFFNIFNKLSPEFIVKLEKI